MKQDHDGGGFLTADLVVQACALMVKKFGLHGLPFRFIRSICIGNIKELLDSYTDIEHRKGSSENGLGTVSPFSDDLFL